MDDTSEQIRRWLDAAFRETPTVTRLDALVRAETFDLPTEAMDIIGNLPPGRYDRQRLCDQLNSAIIARGLSQSLGTHE